MTPDEEIAQARREAAEDLSEQARGCASAMKFFAVILAALAILWLCWKLEQLRKPTAEGTSQRAPYFPIRE